jgi:hypothetical protein
MSKQPKRPRDTNQLAKFIVELASGEIEDRARTPAEHAEALPKCLRTIPAGEWKIAQAKRRWAEEVGATA